MASPPRTQPAIEPITTDLEVADRELLIRLTGPNGSHLRALEKEYGISAGIRGNSILLRGGPDAVSEAERGLAEVLSMLQRGKDMTERDVLRAVRTLKQNPEVRLADYMNEPILVAPRKTIVPKGLAAVPLRAKRSTRTTSSSASARPARARPTWRWRWRCAR